MASSDGFDLIGGAAALPIHAEWKSPGPNFIATAGAAAIGGAFIYATITLHFYDFLAPAAVVAGVLLLVPLSPLLLRRARVYDFGPTEVVCRSRSLLGRKEWQEPLAAYRGILFEREVTAVAWNTGSDSTLDPHAYRLVLLHSRDHRRNVTLCRSLSAADVRAQHEHCCRLFGQPKLERTADGISERAVEDMGKPVRKMAAEGKVKLAFDPAHRPTGGRLTVRVEGDMLCLSARRRWSGIVFGAVLVLAGIAIIGRSAFGLGFLALIPGWCGIWPLLLGVLMMAALLLLRRELLVSGSEVAERVRSPWGVFGRSAIAADAIQDVVLDDTSKGFPSVQVLAGPETITFGDQLTAEERQWVRDCILDVLSM